MMNTPCVTFFLLVALMRIPHCKGVTVEKLTPPPNTGPPVNITLNEDFQELQSPSLDVSSYVYSIWHIHAVNDQLIGVDFLSFNIKSSENCTSGYMEIYEGNTTSSPRFLDRRLCGNQSYRNFLSDTSFLVITYYNDAAEPEEGFSLLLSTEDSCKSDGSFQCWDGTCILQSARCDNKRDCLDDSDEIECVQEEDNFEDFSQCGKQDFAPEFSWNPRPKIVGGDEVVKGSWPWQVAIFKAINNALFCGGTVFAEEWILTAAHCVENLASNRLIVKAGMYATYDEGPPLQTSEVVSSYVHPDYSGVTYYGFDIALLKLETRLTFTAYVRPVCLLSNMNSIPPDGTTCVATGWGYTDSILQEISTTLRQVRLTLRGENYCRRFYNPFPSIPAILIPVPDSIICAGYPDKNADTCQGDSGGPLVCLVGEDEWFQVGITSYGDTPCGVKPGFYASVANLFPWIQEITKLDLSVKSSNSSNAQCFIASKLLISINLMMTLAIFPFGTI